MVALSKRSEAYVKKVRVCLFVIILAWAVTVTFFCFMWNPLPFPDRGHRCFTVPSENAAKVVATILGKLGGLPERFTFDAGPTHQTLLWDNTTVIIWFDPSVPEKGDAISVVVSDPKASARDAATILRQAGFSADIRYDVMPEVGDNKFVLLRSDAFNGWVLAFRRHILAMGSPPNQRKLLK